jgi:hypothetical protein
MPGGSEEAQPAMSGKPGRLLNATTFAWPREAWRPDFSAASGEASRACLKHSLGHAVAMSRAKLTNS